MVVSEREDRREELEHLRGSLKCYGYPGWILQDLKDENNNIKEQGKRSEEVQVTPNLEDRYKITR